MESPDYSHTKDSNERVQMLLKFNFNKFDKIVLVGSSMGAYVSVKASETIKPAGMFLLAPAVNLKGYKLSNPVPYSRSIVAIHGWNDEIVPIKNVFQFSEKHKLHLHVLDSDHNLIDVLPIIEKIFKLFLEQIFLNCF